MKKKKTLGQHFLNDGNISEAIVAEITQNLSYADTVVEVGPGEGALTQYLMQLPEAVAIYLVELDARLLPTLQKKYGSRVTKIIYKDILQLNIAQSLPASFMLAGNFPYNISSQIVFKVIENREQIPVMIGMFQKEVAQRITASAKNRDYGILSVLTQQWYDAEYLFEVSPEKFDPPPKVWSAVIRLKRKTNPLLVDETHFRQVVKNAFSQRRKKLRNALHLYADKFDKIDHLQILDLRAEQLSVADFVLLTNTLYPQSRVFL
ncbi:MAG: 16S rRNA (adenine(1518)-N(6)/adenine(1519)-N(6))-dimethyltransferase RsmA [Chitinophagales bacterium]